MDDTDIKFLRISKEPTVDEKKKSLSKGFSTSTSLPPKVT